MQWRHKWLMCPERVPWRPLHQAPGHIFLIPYILYRKTILDIFIECLTTFIGIVFHFSQLLSQASAVSWGWMFMPQGKRKIITKVLKPLGMVIRNSFSAQYIIWWSLSHILHGDKKSCSPLDNDNSQLLGGSLLFLILHRSPGNQIYVSCLFWVTGNTSGAKNEKKLYVLEFSVLLKKHQPPIIWSKLLTFLIFTHFLFWFPPSFVLFLLFFLSSCFFLSIPPCTLTML